MKKLSTLAVLSMLLTASCVNDSDPQNKPDAPLNKPTMLHASAYVYDPHAVNTVRASGFMYDPNAQQINARSFLRN